MRVFLDANILFSAAKSDGAVRLLVNMLLDRAHTCVVDAYVVEEARRNLAVKGPEAITALEQLLKRFEVAAASRLLEASELVWLPADDRPVLAAAINLRCDALVTGDRSHFGPGYGKTYSGVTVHSPRSLAEALFR